MCVCVNAMSEQYKRKHTRLCNHSMLECGCVGSTSSGMPHNLLIPHFPNGNLLSIFIFTCPGQVRSIRRRPGMFAFYWFGNIELLINITFVAAAHCLAAIWRMLRSIEKCKLMFGQERWLAPSAAAAIVYEGNGRTSAPFVPRLACTCFNQMTSYIIWVGIAIYEYFFRLIIDRWWRNFHQENVLLVYI